MWQPDDPGVDYEGKPPNDLSGWALVGGVLAVLLIFFLLLTGA